MSRIYWIAIAAAVAAVLYLFGVGAHADQPACKLTLGRAQQMLAGHGETWTTYSGVEGARLIGFFDASENVPGFPAADRIMTADGPNGASAVLYVSGDCVTFAMPIATDGLREIVHRLIGRRS